MPPKSWTLSLSIGLLILLTNGANAQWIGADGPWGKSVTSLAVNGNTIYAGTSAGLFKSTNNGTSWTVVISGPMKVNTGVTSLCVNGSIMLAASYWGICYSPDNGVTWGTSTGISGWGARPIVVNGTMFAGTSNGIFASPNGASWVEENSSLTNVNSLAAIGIKMFAGTGSGVFISNNYGANWVPANSGLGGYESSVSCFVVSGTMIFAGTNSGGVFLSSNSGSTWSPVNSGLTNLFVTVLAVSGSTIYAGTNGGVFLSMNNGTSWTKVSTGFADTTITSLALNGGDVFAGTEFGGVFESNNNGASWTTANPGLANAYVNSVVAIGNTLYAGTNAGVFLSNNLGATWNGANVGLTYKVPGYSGAYVTHSFALSGNTVLAGTDGGVFQSTNNGTSWAAINSGLTSNGVYSIAANTGTLFAGKGPSDTGIISVFRSTNSGVSWSPANLGLTLLPYAYAFASSGSSIYVAGTAGVFQSTNNGTSWTAVNSGIVDALGRVPCVQSLAVSGGSIYAGTDVSGVFVSDNGGVAWNAVNTGLTNANVHSLAVSGSAVFAGTDSGICLTINNGTTWTKVDNYPMTNATVYSLFVNGSMIFAGTFGNGVWHRPLSEMIAVSNVERQREKRERFSFQLRNSVRPDYNVTASFSLSNSAFVTVKIYDPSGREIAALVNKDLGPGSHDVLWNTENVPAGFYTVRLQVGNNTSIRSIPIIRQ
jgi:hypothetical protein